MDLEVTSIGADWLQLSRSRWWRRSRKAHRRGVLLYQLITIRVHYVGETPRLTLSDSDGNSVECDLVDAQPDRRGWDLVHNGIVHSVAAGATITPTAVDLLELRDHPVLDLNDLPSAGKSSGDASPGENG